MTIRSNGRRIDQRRAIRVHAICEVSILLVLSSYQRQRDLSIWISGLQPHAILEASQSRVRQGE